MQRRSFHHSALDVRQRVRDEAAGEQEPLETHARGTDSDDNQKGVEELPNDGYASGMRAWFCASHWSNVWSDGLSDRDRFRSRAPANSAAKSRLNWNMFPRSSAPGNPKLRKTSGGIALYETG